MSYAGWSVLVISDIAAVDGTPVERGLSSRYKLASLFENTFLSFFKIQKSVTFYVFLKCHVKKRRKPYPSFTYTNQITGIRRLQN